MGLTQCFVHDSTLQTFFWDRKANENCHHRVSSVDDHKLDKYWWNEIFSDVSSKPLITTLNPSSSVQATGTDYSSFLSCHERCDCDPDNTLSDGELYIDESDGTEKHIYIDRSVDKTIEQNAAKNNLTTSNVKSILRVCIMNQHIQMFSTKI